LRWRGRKEVQSSVWGTRYSPLFCLEGKREKLHMSDPKGQAAYEKRKRSEIITGKPCTGYSKWRSRHNSSKDAASVSKEKKGQKEGKSFVQKKAELREKNRSAQEEPKVKTAEQKSEKK